MSANVKMSANSKIPVNAEKTLTKHVKLNQFMITSGYHFSFWDDSQSL